MILVPGEKGFVHDSTFFILACDIGVDQIDCMKLHFVENMGLRVPSNFLKTGSLCFFGVIV